MLKKATVSLFGLVLASAAFAERQPFDRYQSIVDRQMFGPLPPGFDPTKMPSEVSKTEQKQLTQEQEKLQSSIHFSVINVTPEGVTAVGFTDNTDPKAPVHYYLKVGEKRNGWEVKEADAAAATMTIAKGDIEVSLSLGGNSAKNAGATTRAGNASAAASGRTLGTAPGGKSAVLGGSLAARRRMRAQLAQEEKAKAAAAAAEREEERQAQAAEEKAQREAERAEQRQQLQAIQEELKRVREEKEKAAEKPEGGAAVEAEQNDAA